MQNFNPSNYVRRLELEYNRAVRLEENAKTLRRAWKLARRSERALRELQDARRALGMVAS